MKRLILLVACALLVSCDYTVPLVTTPDMEIDRSAIGLWQGADEDGTTQSLLLLPLSSKEYMISFPSGTKDSMYARACLCKAAGKTLVQIQWFGSGDGKSPDDNRIYQYASYSVTGDSLSFRLLNDEVVNKDAKSSAELSKEIAKNIDNPKLFKKPTVFRKVK